MTLLIIAEPQTIVTIVILEIIGSFAVLLVLEPLAFVLLAIEERICTKTLTFTFYIFALIPLP